jgi:AAA domain
VVEAPMMIDIAEQIAAAVARIDTIPRGRDWLGPFHAAIIDLMKTAIIEAERHDVEVAATALFARRNRTREYGERQLDNILTEAKRLAGPLPLNGLTSRGSAKPRTNGHDPKEREPAEPLPPESAMASPRSNGSANPDVARILTAVRDALRAAVSDNAKLLAIRNGAEALKNIDDDGSAINALGSIAVTYGLQEADIKDAIDQGIEMARVARTFGESEVIDAIEHLASKPELEPLKEPKPKSKPLDPNDILQRHGEDAVRDMFDKAVSEDTAPARSSVRHNESGGSSPKRNAAAIAAALAGLKTATVLQTMTFPQLKYIVQDLIVEGCVLLAGKPKVRKSWLAYDVGLAVASGRYCLGDKKCVQGDVLYLALEDGDRRLQRRATKLLPTFSGKWPERFQYQTKWPRANEGGIDAIDQWCEAHPDARLVVIDVLARFRAPSTNKNAYEQDYEAVSRLQELAVRRSITILIVHHTRKGAAEDPVEEISGTLGLGGGVDAFLILKRTSSGGTLIGRGRDTEDVDLAMQFNNETCRWTILGQAAEIQRSEQRGRVLVALEEAATVGLSPKEIVAEVDGLTHDNAKQLLRRMLKAGEIQKGSYGRYFHASVTLPVPSVTPVTLSSSKRKRSKSTTYDGEKSDSGRVTGVTSVTVDDDLTSSKSGEDAVQTLAGQSGGDGQ